MKFTKEDANKELVAKMTANGERLSMSDRTINEHLDTLMPFVGEEMELQDFIDKALPLFKSTNSNVRNDVSAGIKAYKEANPVAPQPQQPQDTTPQTNDYSELVRRVEELENEKAKVNREKKVSSIKDDVFSKLKSKGVKNEAWINTLLSEVNITEDFDVDSKVESYLGLYNKQNAVINPTDPPKSPEGGKSKWLEDALAEAANFAKEMSL